MSRCPQGRPVIFQAGSSRAGQAFAARYADVVLGVQIDLGSGPRLLRVPQGATSSRAGVTPMHCKILPGFLPVVGGTEAEAKAKLDTLAGYVDESVGFLHHDRFASATISRSIPSTARFRTFPCPRRSRATRA